MVRTESSFKEIIDKEKINYETNVEYTANELMSEFEEALHISARNDNTIVTSSDTFTDGIAWRIMMDINTLKKHNIIYPTFICGDYLYRLTRLGEKVLKELTKRFGAEYKGGIHIHDSVGEFFITLP
jgi:hypothetical protein